VLTDRFFGTIFLASLISGGIVKLLAPALALCLSACGPLIAEYSVEAYKNATTLKAETEALVDKSAQPYGSSKKDIDALTTKINAAYEFAAGMPFNQISAQQWQILRDPNGTLYGEFLRVWKQQNTLGAGFRTEEKAQLDEAFDYIICLEANKQAPKVCGVTQSASSQAAAITNPQPPGKNPTPSKKK
jgi:hypothetical protein